MANSGTSIDNGTQQVTIYPKQIISSIYGNETLYNVVQPGIENSTVDITTSGTGLLFTISAGTTLFFLRKESDPLTPAQDVYFIGKVSLTTAAVYETDIATFVSAYGTLGDNDPLYLVADWDYSENTKFVDFRLELTAPSYIGVESKLLIAKILNVKDAITGIFNSSKMHVSYELQQNRNTLNKLYTTDNSFMVQFESDGGGVNVNSGNTFTGNSFIGNSTLSSVLVPPLGLITYLSNENTGSVITITGNESDYYQVDFLRAKYTEESPHSVEYVWESFLVPATNLFDTVPTKQQIIEFLADQRQFNIVGNAYTIMVSIRERNSLNSSTITKNIWPETCIIFNESSLDQSVNPVTHQRLKVPVYSASDLAKRYKMKQQVWKLAWNPQGYSDVTFDIDTAKNSVNDIIKLPHTFFKSDGFSCAIRNSNIMITCGIRGTDIVFMSPDSSLTSLSNTPVYESIKLATAKVVNKVLTITCSFIGDIIDPKDFGQKLTPDSDVYHKSISTDIVDADIGNYFEVNSNMVNTDRLSLTNDSYIDGTTIKLEDVEISEGKLSLGTESFSIEGKTNYIRYNPEYKCFKIRSVDTGEEVSLARMYKMERKDGAIFFSNNTLDSSALLTTDWLYIDGADQSLHVPTLHVSKIFLGDLELTAEKIEKLKKLLE